MARCKLECRPWNFVAVRTARSLEFIVRDRQADFEQNPLEDIPMVPRAVFAVPIAFLASLVWGCSPSQGDIEKSIRDGMKSQLGVATTSIDLTKQADGAYLGTATAENGDVYEVTATPPKDYKIEWKAFPGQVMVEQRLREGLEQQLSSKVKTLQLTKHGPGSYSGPAELTSGVRVIVSTRMAGAQLMWEAKPASP
jgi:hypothetical protein